MAVYMTSLSEMTSLYEAPAIEFLIIANHVEAVNGLLYISGGGWTDHYRPASGQGQPFLSRFGVGVSVLVPWNETNRQHRVTVDVEDHDSTMVLAHTDAQFTVGRPPTLPQGGEQHMVLGIAMALVFPKAGGYRVVARLDTNETRRWPFRVHDVPPPAGYTPPR